MRIKKWSSSNGDYIEDQINDNPYEMMKRNRKRKKIILNLLFSLFAAGVLVLVLSLLTSSGSKG